MSMKAYTPYLNGRLQRCQTVFRLTTTITTQVRTNEMKNGTLLDAFIQAPRLFNVSLSDKQRVDGFWKDGNDNDIILEPSSNMARMLIQRSHFRCLQPEGWMWDEVINTYIVSFLRDRDTYLCEHDSQRKPSLFFNTFLMANLFCASSKSTVLFVLGLWVAVHNTVVPLTFRDMERYSSLSIPRTVIGL